MEKKYFTKDILRNFIKESAKDFKMTEASYLENIASRCYVVLEGARPVCWEDGSIMTLSSKALAKEEAKEYEKSKVISEYDYYVSRGVFAV